MNYLGNIFKTVRQARHLSLEEACGGDFSVSMLSRFENGKSEMSAQKLWTCLENIYFDVNEFNSLVSEFQPTELELLHRNIQRFRNPFQKHRLQALLNEQEKLFKTSPKKQFYRLNTIWIKSVIQAHDDFFQTPQEDIQFLMDYLFSTDFWTRYELLLFSDTDHLFPIKTYLEYCKEMLQRSEFWRNNFVNSNYVHTILINGLFRCIEADELFSARTLINLMEQHFSNTRDAYMKITQMIAVGYYEAKKGKTSGREKIDKGIRILEDLNYDLTANYYREALEEVL